MARIYNNLTDLIGNTPLLELHNWRRNRGLAARLLVKIEYFNPAGSVKDRIAWALIRDAEERGLLQPGGKIVDVTSGNTGIALATVAAARGYSVRIYASDNISPDKFRLLEHYGAEVIKVDNAFFLDPEALEKIQTRIRDENPAAVFTDQLSNAANPQAHYSTTGPEIWQATGGQVDVLVAGVGTGGTISGTGRYLREHNPQLRLAIAEPAFDSLPDADNTHAPEIDGVHHVTEALPSQLPANFDRALVDEIITLSPLDAGKHARALAQEEGILAGPSAGAILFAATELARRPDLAGRTIVAILPDSGERYLNAPLFNALR